MPVKYQGSKQRYATKIAAQLYKFGADWYSLPFYECCCGSAAVSLFTGRYVTLIDMGPWGVFWDNFQDNKEDCLKFLLSLEPTYKQWIRKAAVSPIPLNSVEYAVTFLALQREAFNGKPVEQGSGYWRYPGFGQRVSFNKVKEAMEHAFRVRIKNVLRSNINYFTIPEEANVYMDPDYGDTTGYGDRQVYVESFVRRHRHCNLVISYHEELSGDWDKIVDITQIGRRNNTRELLHIRRKTHETPYIKGRESFESQFLGRVV